MKKSVIMMGLTAAFALLFTGCGAAHALEGAGEAAGEEVSEEQLIEVAAFGSDGVIRQITQGDDIVEYTRHLDAVRWEESDPVPEEAQPLYIFTSYAKVTEEVFLKNGAPQIAVGRETLYRDGDTYYIREESLSDPDVSAFDYRIAREDGEYLLDLTREESDIRDKDEIFAAWGVTGGVPGGAGMTAQDRAAGTGEDETGKNGGGHGEELRAKDLERVSKEQRLEIVFTGTDQSYVTTDLEKIADFYNHLEKSEWEEAEGLPEEAQQEKICAVTTFQLKRHTLEEELIENERLTLYGAGDDHYILDAIPDRVSGAGWVERYYRAPAGVAQYLEGFRR